MKKCVSHDSKTLYNCNSSTACSPFSTMVLLHYCSVNIFVLYGDSFGREGDAEFGKEKLCSADKLRPAQLRNPLKETLGAREPEGLDFICVTGGHKGRDT